MESSLAKIEPKVGMPVTYSIGSDSYSYTIVEILSPKRLAVCADDVMQVGNFYGDQEHVITEKGGGRMRFISLRKNGVWREMGEHCGYWELGKANNYMDPGF